jgi:hypothetical protein
MKKIVFTFLVIFVGLFATAQKINIKKGTILKYKINKEIDFIITFTNVGKTIAFGWQRINGEDTSTGTVRIGEKALVSGKKYVNSFKRDTETKLTDASTLTSY